MALKRISDLTAATTPLAGTELLELELATGEPRKCTTQDIADLVPASTGDVVGPASAVDGNIATFDGTTGKLIEDGGATIAEVRSIPQNSQSAAYSLVLSDAGKHIYHPSADTTARTWTIPANATVAFPIGTAVTFVNDTSAGAITIAITTDTLVLMGSGATGSRTLAPSGIATAVKVASTRWVISGVNLS